jgi:hypothetical protein
MLSDAREGDHRFQMDKGDCTDYFHFVKTEKQVVFHCDELSDAREGDHRFHMDKGDCTDYFHFVKTEKQVVIYCEE